MTLIEALEETDYFVDRLGIIVSEVDPDRQNYSIKGWVLQLYSWYNIIKTVSNETPENRVILDWALRGIDSRFLRLFYISDLNKVFSDNNISEIRMYEANTWWLENMLDLSDYIDDINYLCDSIRDKLNAINSSYENR
jgi:hypothetical protein